MTSTKHCLSAGLLTIAVTTLVLVGQLGLVLTFGYPEVFHKPVAEVLEAYHRGGGLVTLSWFVFALGALLMVPLVVLYARLLEDDKSSARGISAAFGAVAGVAYVIGIMRWVLLARFLSAQVAAPQATPESRQQIALIFQAFDIYCGNSFGETIAPICHGLWVLFFGLALLHIRLFPRWLCWAQVGFGVLIATRPLEYVGLGTFAEVADVGTGIWTVMLLGMGVALVRMASGGGKAVTPKL